MRAPHRLRDGRRPWRRHRASPIVLRRGARTASGCGPATAWRAPIAVAVGYPAGHARWPRGAARLRTFATTCFAAAGAADVDELWIAQTPRPEGELEGGGGRHRRRPASPSASSSASPCSARASETALFLISTTTNDGGGGSSSAPARARRGDGARRDRLPGAHGSTCAASDHRRADPARRRPGEPGDPVLQSAGISDRGTLDASTTDTAYARPTPAVGPLLAAIFGLGPAPVDRAVDPAAASEPGERPVAARLPRRHRLRRPSAQSSSQSPSARRRRRSGRQTRRPRARLMTRRWTSLVPSPISRTLASR